MLTRSGLSAPAPAESKSDSNSGGPDGECRRRTGTPCRRSGRGSLIVSIRPYTMRAGLADSVAQGSGPFFFAARYLLHHHLPLRQEITAQALREMPAAG